MALASFFFYLSVPLFTPAAAACVMLESAGVGEASKGTAEARQCGERERRGREKKGDRNGGRGARGKRKKEIELEVGGDGWEFSALVLGGSHCFPINPSVFFILLLPPTHIIIGMYLALKCV
jgi:hypothetical protein